MNIDFEELDYRDTSLGELSLRRRTQLSLGVEVFEVKLGDKFLMSSLFTEGEIALANKALGSLPAGPLDVLVGGLGLGYTAQAVLAHPGVRSLLVIEAVPDVIDWHRKHMVPLGEKLTEDRRCEFWQADFFALMKSGSIGPSSQCRRFDAIVVDIDHSPRDLLHPSHASFYTRDGMQALKRHLKSQGVFGLWSNDPPDDRFRTELAAAFDQVEVHVVTFHNPLQNRDAANSVYLARTPNDNAHDAVEKQTPSLG